MKASNPTDFKLTKVILFPNGDKPEFPITALVNNIEYVENITYPFISAKMEIVDSIGLLGSVPLQGGEAVQIEVSSDAFDKSVTYNFVIWTIQNRFAKQQKQSYDVGLVSSEALINEANRVNKLLTGNPESIVVDLMKNSLKTVKPVFSEASKFDIKMLPNRKRPFDLIADIALKSVSPQTNYVSTNSGNANQTEQQIKGSGGFFFWETVRGYNFFAVDSLCADENSPLKSKKLDSPAWGQYVERMGNEEGGDTRFHILESTFESEINLLSSLRRGKYSSLMVFFNHSTGQYEEYVYRIKDSYDNMAHLGGQEGITLIPTNDIELSDYPTRIMSIFLDHESWYNEKTPASPDPKDGSTSPSQFADWQKFYMAQSVARYKLLSNQLCTIVIPGNPDICAGDKIDIRLVNKVPTKQGNKEPFDPESSGVYLISEVSHFYDTTMGPGGKFTTTLRLMRDSYGMKDLPSNHGTK